jgi:hypothetical protein
MTEPNFFYASNTATDPTGARHAAPGLNYAFSVLDGSHPTDRIQLSVIEGVDRLSAVDWTVRKKPTDTNTIEIVHTRTGTIEYSGTALYPLFNSLTASANFIDGQVIGIKPDMVDGYNAGTGSIRAEFTKDVVIYGYGARIRGGASAASGTSGALRQHTAGKSLIVYGVTFDASQDGTSATKRLGTLISAGSTGSDITPLRIIVKDCHFLNVWTSAITVEAAGNASGVAPCMVIVENCFFDAGTTDTLGEHLSTNAVRDLYVYNCRFLGNKPAHTSAQTQTWTNTYVSNNGLTTNTGLEARGKTIAFSNVYMLGMGLRLRPYTTKAFAAQYSSANKISVSGAYIDTTGSSIEIQGYNNTHVVDTANIQNCWIGEGAIAVVNAHSGQTHSKIKMMTVENCFINTFDAGGVALVIEDHDVDFLSLRNIKTPAYSAGLVPMRINANQSAVTILYANIEDIEPTTDGNIVALNDSGTAGQAITVNLKSPLIKGQNGLKAEGGGGTKTLKFHNNQGRNVFSGTGSATAFTIPHNLVSSPNLNKIQVTPGSAAANGNFHVTADATNITVTYGTAPASGTNNVVLYWMATLG